MRDRSISFWKARRGKLEERRLAEEDLEDLEALDDLDLDEDLEEEELEDEELEDEESEETEEESEEAEESEEESEESEEITPGKYVAQLVIEVFSDPANLEGWEEADIIELAQSVLEDIKNGTVQVDDETRKRIEEWASKAPEEEEEPERPSGLGVSLGPGETTD